MTFEEILDYDLQTGKFLQNQFQLNPDPSEKIVTNQELTSLDLLNAVVPFTIADATCDLDYHRAHMSENIEAFGQKGADNVKAFINSELKKYHEKELAAYKLEEPFETDLTQLKVTLGFECIVEGREGKGTDYVYVDSKKLLTKIVAVRH